MNPDTEQQVAAATLPQRLARHGWLAAAGLLVALAAPLAADQLEIEVEGVSNALRAQVESRVIPFQVSGDTRLSERRLERIAESVAREAAAALRPHGYYHAHIHTELVPIGENAWRLDVHIERGEPVRVAAATVELAGPGASVDELEAWRRDWPLTAGKRLNQVRWEEEKRAALELAEAHGYLGAAFTEHRIEADLVRNEAILVLKLDTGPQAVLGDIRFEQNAVRPGILEHLPRFDAGQPYDAWLLEKFRVDLWRAGYFDEIEVIEERRLDESPPVVNLVVTANARKPNTYQGTLGYGTDTGVRAQLLWNRHLLSPRGDSFDMGLGWQQKNNEFSFRTGYRLPRSTRAREFWTADFIVRRENQDFEVRPDEDDADFITLANGDATDYSVKAGRLIVRDRDRGYAQLFETWYVQYVLEDNTFSPVALPPEDGGVAVPTDFEEFDAVDSSVAIGINWDWPVVRGQAFETEGHHERAWIFTANEAWGSGKDFTQAYLSSSWHRMLGRRFKLLLRGEVGYSDADVEKFIVDLGEDALELSVTNLPNLYRFKAGGSRSVRGYAFESLDNNGLGSNHIVTASAEIEMNFRERWSVAAFFDVGNAFNSWDDLVLRRGAGVGLRWYSIAGPIRLDVAQGLDYSGEPWRIHFTIGTPLL